MTKLDDVKKVVKENRPLIKKIGDAMEKSKLPFFRKLVGWFRP